ncbi:hypothetical protein [Variovorax sp. LjRoot178]|uniref:hypothetical protein n=1 Tax=Variovorax sp. LjRoot178 TaxID=3342277 RepID=UPI003F50FF9C
MKFDSVPITVGADAFFARNAGISARSLAALETLLMLLILKPSLKLFNPYYDIGTNFERSMPAATIAARMLRNRYAASAE